jgi:hypothetical protein
MRRDGFTVALDPSVGIHLIMPTYRISSLQEAEGATVQKNVFPLNFFGDVGSQDAYLFSVIHRRPQARGLC